MLEAPEATLADVAGHLRDRGVAFALVGGLAISIRGEVRFTRDVDLAVALSTDAAMEALVHALAGVGYRPIAIVEHEARKRLATSRLESPHGVVVDLLAASCGIEAEVVARATLVLVEGAGEVPVARAALGLAEVRELLDLITRRGFDRGQDLARKLDGLLEGVREGTV